MTYVPSNVDVFTAAFSGALAGITSNTNAQAPLSSVANLMPIAGSAGAYAQAVDLAWSMNGMGVPSALDISSIDSASESYFKGRVLGRAASSQYTSLAAALIRCIQAARNYYTAEGITPPPNGEGGSSFPNRTTANAYPGTDIGMQINAACAAMSLLGGGIVEVEDGDYDLATRVIVEENVTLKFGAGTVSTSLLSSVPPYRLKDNASIIGAGFNSILMNPVSTPDTFFATAIGDYLSWIGTPGGPVGNSNILVKDIQIIGNPASTITGSQSAAAHFGNVRNTTVRDCLFKDVEGYGTFAASSAASGNHSDGFSILSCTFENVRTQNCGIINGRNGRIQDNLFRPSDVTTGPTLIDCELNENEDICENIIISDNIFDLRSIAQFSAGALIQILGVNPIPYADTGRPRHILVSNNIVLAGSSTVTCFTTGIGLAASDHVNLVDNEILYCQLQIQLAQTHSCIVADNNLHGGGNLSQYSMVLQDARDCLISDNHFHDTTSGAWSRPWIAEVFISVGPDYNIFSGNRLSFYPPVPGGPAGLDVKIDLVGPNSRVFNSWMGPYPIPTDAAVAVSLVELKALPIPGSRPVGSPPVTLTGGRIAQADGGFALWKYDPASTATDNGVTVIKPDFQTGAGRWIRSPQNLRLTTAERDALVLTTTDEGFTIWNTQTKVLNYWNGTTW